MYWQIIRDFVTLVLWFATVYTGTLLGYGFGL